MMKEDISEIKDYIKQQPQDKKLDAIIKALNNLTVRNP